MIILALEVRFVFLFRFLVKKGGKLVVYSKCLEYVLMSKKL